MRHFVRHPSEIPVDVRVISERASHTSQICNVSNGGLCCDLAQPLPVGALVDYRIPQIAEDYLGCGRVVWCERQCQGFRVGIQFSNEQDAYRARMVEQLCQIECYRRRVAQTEGRQLSGEQAAAEWISRHAADFDRCHTLSDLSEVG